MLCCGTVGGPRGRGGRLRGSGLTVLLVLFWLVIIDEDLRLPETLLKEVDEGLAQVLPRPLAVEEVTLVWVDL